MQKAIFLWAYKKGWLYNNAKKHNAIPINTRRYLRKIISPVQKLVIKFIAFFFLFFVWNVFPAFAYLDYLYHFIASLSLTSKAHNATSIKFLKNTIQVAFQSHLLILHYQRFQDSFSHSLKKWRLDKSFSGSILSNELVLNPRMHILNGTWKSQSLILWISI